MIEESVVKTARKLMAEKVLLEKYTDELIDYHVKHLHPGRACCYIDLCMLNGKEVVRKIFFSREIYRRERDNYHRLINFEHTPKMLNNDDCSKTIITEYVGPDVRQLFSTNTERNIYLPLVKIAYNKLFSEYGLHHNDLVWKNITIKDNKAYFIDLGRVRPQLLDEDSQQILKNIQLEINNFNDLFDLNT